MDQNVYFLTSECAVQKNFKIVRKYAQALNDLTRELLSPIELMTLNKIINHTTHLCTAFKHFDFPSSNKGRPLCLCPKQFGMVLITHVNYPQQN